MAPRICVVGSSNMDLIVRTSRLPKPGETLRAHSFATCHGGKGGNQAVMAARLGAKVTIVGKVGRDTFGEQIRKGYEKEGIDTTFLFEDKQPTGVATILVDDRGENCILVVAGANNALRPIDIRRAAKVIRSADVLLCQLEVPMDATMAALRLGHNSPTFSILNPAPAQPLPIEAFQIIDALVPNETELGQLTALPVETPVQMEKAAKRLWNKGPGHVLVTLGERGIMDVGGQPTWRQEAIAVKAVDTSGAGDAFIGALAVYIAQRVPWVEAVKRAMAVAALTVTRPGTQSSYPTHREATAFLNQHGLRNRE